MDNEIDCIVLSFFGFKVEAVVEVVKVLIEFGLSGHAARDCWLGWFWDGPDGAILLLRLLLRVGFAERPETIAVWRHWFGRSLRPGEWLNSPKWSGGCHKGAEGSISTKQYTCLH
jgi:hypothetical protein